MNFANLQNDLEQYGTVNFLGVINDNEMGISMSGISDPLIFRINWAQIINDHIVSSYPNINSDVLENGVLKAVFSV